MRRASLGLLLGLVLALLAIVGVAAATSVAAAAYGYDDLVVTHVVAGDRVGADDASSQVSDSSPEAVGSRRAGGEGTGTTVALRFVAPRTSSVVDDALGGGRHSGFLNNYAGRSPAEIQRAMRSIQTQIDDHLSWIDDPYRKIPDWDKLDPRQQQALVTQKWPGDVQRQREQLEILEHLLDQGGT